QMQETAASLVQELTPLTRHPVTPCEIDLNLPDSGIQGWLTALYSSGRISYRPTKLKAKDLLQLWIGHLVLCLLRPEGIEQVSMHVATDTTVCFQAIEDPAAELAPFLHYYRQGLSEPLHFYPETSYARAKAKTETAAINGARRAWHSGFKHTGEGEEQAYRIALRGQDPLDAQFEELAALFLPILGAMKMNHATP
ncbi:MAG: hypothetical protein L3J49_05570, partial [Desulfobulbaceae bacterium]|nr:hypothetical protein [Desulfobulbaceae bacterium]